jgi:LPS export ABC transporter permease LptF
MREVRHAARLVRRWQAAARRDFHPPTCAFRLPCRTLRERSGTVKILDRYILRQLLLTAFFAVAVLSVVLVLGNVFKKLLELLVNQDAPIDLILSFIAYILPFSLTFTIPWGFLTAVLLLFGKMSAENEIIALRSSGVSIPRVCAGVLVVALACVGTCLYINLKVAPEAQVKMKDALYNIATNNPLSMFGSDKVIDQFPGRKIYVERNEGAELYNLIVYELSDNYDPMRVIYAKRGLLETDKANKQILLHIYDGRFEQRDENDPNILANIRQGITMQESTVPISLEELYEQNKKKRGLGSFTVDELIKSLNEDQAFKDNEADSDKDGKKLTAKEIEARKKKAIEVRTATKTELSKRFSFSLASLAFGLIGVPLAMTAQRKETSVGFLLSLVVAFTYFLFIIIADTFKTSPKMHPELMVWAPNVLFIGLGLYMFIKLSRR